MLQKLVALEGLPPWNRTSSPKEILSASSKFNRLVKIANQNKWYKLKAGPTQTEPTQF